MASPILDRNLHIRAIDAYIDPSVPRERAIITHGHADHARSGHGAVLATPDTIAIMKVRYGEDCAGSFEALDFGVPYRTDDVTITFYPAGHILGSAQVLVEQSGQRVVVTGDYKRLADRTAQPYELVELPLVISDQCDWGELQQTIQETRAETVWVTHGREDALVYWCRQQGLTAEQLNIIGFEDGGGAGADE